MYKSETILYEDHHLYFATESKKYISKMSFQNENNVIIIDDDDDDVNNTNMVVAAENTIIYIDDIVDVSMGEIVNNGIGKSSVQCFFFFFSINYFFVS